MKRPNKKDYDFNDVIEGVRFAQDMINYADYIENKLTQHNFLEKLNRVELINQDGRSYIDWEFSIEKKISIVNDGKTLKVLIL